MGTLNLGDFRDELLFDLKNRTDTTTSDGFSVARQNLFINSAYLHVTHPSVFRHREIQFRYTLTLVSGQQGYVFTPAAGTPPGDISAVRSVAHVAATTDDPLAFHTKVVPHDEQWFQDRTLVLGGPPRDYFLQANILHLSPVPGADQAGQVLVVTAFRDPDLLVLDADLTILTPRWDEIILLAARWRAELHLGYRDLAEATKLDFVSLINEYQTFEQLHGEDWDWVSEVRNERSMESANA